MPCPDVIFMHESPPYQEVEILSSLPPPPPPLAGDGACCLLARDGQDTLLTGRSIKVPYKSRFNPNLLFLLINQHYIISKILTGQSIKGMNVIRMNYTITETG